MQIRQIAPLLAATAVVAGPVAAGTVVVSLGEPSLDRWNYPFNQSPGTKPEIGVFAPLTATGFDPLFDNRDGQLLAAFETSGDVPPGLGVSDYTVTSARVILEVSSDETFQYDPTLDPWTSFLLPGDPSFTADPDAGRPVELFGAGFRNGWTADTYLESSPFCDGCNCFLACKEVRNVFPIDFDGGLPRDVSNNVDDQFDPAPFATGVNAGLAQGQVVPSATELTFEIDVADLDIHEYLAEGLDAGELVFVVASIFESEPQVGGSFPEFYAKEHILVQVAAADAARLELTVVTGLLGDTNDDDKVNVTDLLAVLASWGACSGCPADVNCDGAVNVTDLLLVLAEWTPAP